MNGVHDSEVLKLSPSKRRLVLFAAAAAMFMSAVESTIIATAMPSIVSALGGFGDFSWVFAAYLLGQGVTTLIYGRLADIFGRKIVLSVATLIFLSGTTLCSLSSSMFLLILSRSLQGLGSGALVSVSMTIIADIYPPRERARVQGYLNALWGGAAIIGPLLGAFLVATLGWPSVFWINIPIGFVMLGVLWYAFKENRPVEVRHVDVVGGVLLALGVGTFMLGLVKWASIEPIELAALALGSFSIIAVLVIYERRVAEPILPLDLWRNSTVSSCNLAALVTGIVMMADVAFVPTYVQALMGRSAVVAGLTLSCQSVGWMITGATTGRLLGRHSFWACASAGGALLVAGSIVLCTLKPEDGPIFAGTGAFNICCGKGFCNTTYLVAAQNAVPKRHRGAATSSNVFTRLIGQAIGAALLGGVMTAGIARGHVEPGDVIRQLTDQTLRQALDVDALASNSAIMADALFHTFTVAAGFACIALALALRLPRRGLQIEE